MECIDSGMRRKWNAKTGGMRRQPETAETVYKRCRERKIEEIEETEETT
jgi:LPS O-antigen subunit length determinant protein (WzzB/FepE family)